MADWSRCRTGATTSEYCCVGWWTGGCFLSSFRSGPQPKLWWLIKKVLSNLSRTKSGMKDQSLSWWDWFVNVAGLRADVNGTILVLDGDEKHAPRILEFNLRGRRFLECAIFPVTIPLSKTDLRDFAYDWETGHAYIVDMGQADLTKPAQPATSILICGLVGCKSCFCAFDGLMPPEAAVKLTVRY